MPIVARLNQYASLQATEFDEVNATKVNVSAAGTFYALEFFEQIVGVNTQTDYIMQPYNVVEETFGETPGPKYSRVLTANVYKPYYLVEADFGIPSYGPGDGTYMRRTYPQEIVVYNEIDEITQF